jgi:hypothetical protein
MASEKIIFGILNGSIPRSERLQIYENAKDQIRKGLNAEIAREVMHVIDTTAVPPLQAEYVFMGYCPDAKLENRQDDIWIKDGICEYNWVSDAKQLSKFDQIMVGDTIILKKREIFGETMKIHAHGKITKRETSDITKKIYFRVDWRVPKEFLIVPLMACNSTVNPRSIENVERAMHEDFWAWLKEGGEKEQN